MSSHPEFADFREEWIADIRQGDPSNTELGHRFAHKILTQWRDVDEASDDVVYCDGAGDGGIDIAYLDRDGETSDENDGLVGGHTWYLVQSKYGSAFQGTGTLLEESQKVIDTLDGNQDRLSSLAKGLQERLRTFRRKASDRDRMTLVFATEEPLNEEQIRVLRDVRAMGRERFGSIFDVEAVSIETIYSRVLDDTSPDSSHSQIPLKADLASSGDDLLVGAVSLLDLYEFLKTYRSTTQDLDQLYEKNVRRFLGNRRKVNRAMQQTLREEPHRFGLYNNGITIVVTDFEKDGSDTVNLTEPYVVNGCQTTRTIWEVLHKRLESGGTGQDPETASWQEQLRKGVVVLKLVKVGADGEELLEKITRSTNSQNAVSEKDFLALTKDFRAWKKEMEEKYNVYLEIQRGGWDSQRALQKQNPTITRQFDEAVYAFNLLKVYGSGWLGEAGTAFARNAPFEPDGRIFKKLVNNEVEFGVDDLYAAHLLRKAAVNYQFVQGTPKSTRRQTRFLFYMITIELLKDVIIRADISSDPQPKTFTRSLLQLFEPGNEEQLDALLDTAAEVVDGYLTPGTDETIFDEPAYNDRFNNDLNAFLKWEQLGKSEESTPRLRSLIGGYKKALGWSAAGQLSRRDLITAAIKE